MDTIKLLFVSGRVKDKVQGASGVVLSEILRVAPIDWTIEANLIQRKTKRVRILVFYS